MTTTTQQIQSPTNTVRERAVNSSRLPSLDGWRAISIILVLGAHSLHTDGFPPKLIKPFNLLFHGVLGVRFFFIISGFLITWLMIFETNQAGRVNLKHFYARRALRILPVYMAFLAVVGILQLCTAYSQNLTSWIGNLTFTTDFVRENPWTSDHLWSLSVEEQFYLLWPVTFLWCITKRARLLIILLMLPLFIAPFSRWVVLVNEASYPAFLAGHYATLSAIYKAVLPNHSFFNYFDSLAVGCGAAILLSRREALVRGFLTKNVILVALLGIALLFIPYCVNKLSWVTGIVTPLGPTIQSFGFAILLLQSILLPRWGFYTLLNLGWVCRIGVLSYSIYIWQQIFSSKAETFGWAPVWWMSFPGWLVPIFVVAIISYYGFERPLLRLRTRLRKA